MLIKFQKLCRECGCNIDHYIEFEGKTLQSCMDCEGLIICNSCEVILSYDDSFYCEGCENSFCGGCGESIGDKWLCNNCKEDYVVCECGETHSTDYLYSCNVCGNTVCDNCSFVCNNCDGIHCESCHERCDDCKENVCSNCITDSQCSKCKEEEEQEKEEKRKADELQEKLDL
jgi:hypothetical protein